MPKPTDGRDDSLEVHVGARAIQVVRHSITDLPALDALVSSDDNLLTHGGGVSRALWRAAGPALAREVAAAQPALRLGDVHATGAGELRARVLLHAVTIDLAENRVVGSGDVARLFRQVLVAAEDRDCRSLGLPLLGTGVAGLDPDHAIRGLLVALNAWLNSPSRLEHIVIATLDEAHELRAGIAVLAGRTPVEELVPRADDAGLVDARGALAPQWEALAAVPVAERGTLAAVFFEDATRAALLAALGGLERGLLEQLSGELDGLAGQGSVGASADADAAYELMRRLPLGTLVHLLEMSASIAGRPLDAAVSAALAEATLARNRLAHQRPATIDDLDLVMAGARHLLEIVALAGPAPARVFHSLETSSFKAQQEESISSIEDPRPAHRLERTRDRSSQQMPLGLGFGAASVHVARSNATPSAPVVTVGHEDSGTRHVRRLHQFLLKHLPDDARTALDARLQAEGYDGTPEMRLLEHCVRVEDVAQFLADQFSNVQLTQVVPVATGRTPRRPASSRELAEQLLDHFGFPRPERPEGLAAAQREVAAARTDIQLGLKPDLAGAVGPVARRLEYVCQVLLRFVAMAAYRQAPESLFRGWGLLGGGDTLNKATLGRLFELVERLADRLAQDDSPEVRIFERDFKGRRLFPSGAGSMPSIRNSFVHFREDDAGRTPADWRARALRFLEDAEAFLVYLGHPDTRVFPHLVLVKEIRIDRWARRVAHATNDEARQEIVFTDTPLEAGRVYFMHPLTNPLRVDPILVPAGDLVWVDVR